MSNPFIGQVSVFAFPFAPVGWAFCDGAEVPINQYSTLFALIGNTFGGNGTHTIGLPGLTFAAPCGTGQGAGLTNRPLGDTFGSGVVTITQNTMPAHNHVPNGVGIDRGDTATEIPTAASGVTVANGVTLYSNGAATGLMSSAALTATGGEVTHNNEQPYIAMNYCIALSGTYPTFP